VTARTPRGRRYLQRLGADEAARVFLGRALAAGPAPVEVVPTAQALGRVTAAAVAARNPAPFYHSSAMDGLAVDAAATFAASETNPARLAVPGDAVWVDTGDPIPPGKTAVVPSEELHWRGEGMAEVLGPAAPWDNVRVTGQEIATGEMVLPRGWRVGPADLGALLAAGVTGVAVRRRPRVAIFPTGTELIAPGAPLEVGKVVEFNSEIVAGMVREEGGEPRIEAPLPDDLDAVRAAIRRAAADAEAVVVLAGSSAGSEDFTPRAIELEGELLAHGVNIAPGKPTALGLVGGRGVIGLPGFPVAAVVSARLFLCPLLRRLLGAPEPVPATVRAVLPRALPSRLDSREFVRVRLGRVGAQTFAYPLPRGSAAILSWTRAQGVVAIPEGVEGLEAGAAVDVELLRGQPDLERTVVLIGSHDLLIDVLEDELRARGVTLLASATGSLGGLLALRDGTAHLATSHLLDTETGAYNRSYVAKYLGGRAVRQVGLVWREQGLMVAPGNPKGIAGWEDLGRADVSFVNRQKGSGSRVLLDYRLGLAGVAPAAVNGYRREEYTHWAVAMAVQSGLADCGLGIRSAAAVLGLDFVPLEEEEFDLLIPEEHAALPGMRALLETTASDSFRARVLALGGYRFRS
jgi:putative molybdopterin biosynthesis protein